jgi:hypothetical protein
MERVFIKMKLFPRVPFIFMAVYVCICYFIDKPLTSLYRLVCTAAFTGLYFFVECVEEEDSFLRFINMPFN